MMRDVRESIHREMREGLANAWWSQVCDRAEDDGERHLPTFSHFLIVLSINFSLCLSLSINFSLSLSLSLWDGRSPGSHPTCDVPFPPRRSGENRKRMIPGRPLCQGIGLGSGPSSERVGDWGGPAVWAL